MTPELSSISTDGGNCDLVRELKTRQVAFLFVGGAAVAIHGCRTQTHFEEIDIFLDPTTENAERAISALIAAGVGVPFSATDLAQPHKQVPVRDWRFDVDILTPRTEETYSVLAARSVQATLNNVMVNVISRSDLIAMKRIAAAEASDPAKHSRDLECLEGPRTGATPPQNSV